MSRWFCIAFPCLLLVNAVVCSGQDRIAAKIQVGKTVVLYAESNQSDASDAEQNWQRLADLKFLVNAEQKDFSFETDETNGNRATLTGEVLLEVSGAGQLSLQKLILARKPGSDQWYLATGEFKRVSRLRARARGEKIRPNVLVILCDDIRWNALSCAGHPYLVTPNIDQLAAEGIYFENMFCTTSLCSPSRASILSGLYAHTHGVTNNFTEYPKGFSSFPIQLQKSGYETAYVGKWHMGEKNDEPRPGFDYFVTHKGQGLYYDTTFNIDGEGPQTLPGYYTHRVTDLATDWLDKPRDKPFMLMVGQKAPHSFYLPEPKYAHTFDDVEVNYPQSAFHLEDNPKWMTKRLDTWHGIYGPLFAWRKNFPDKSAAGVMDFARMIRAYWGTILSVDDSVGKLTEKLRQMGELDNTVIVFLGDNGLLEGEHGMVDKRTMHEASIRVPMIVRYPGLTPTHQPKRITQQVLTLDVAPTIIDLCQAEPLPRVHGRSFKKLVQQGDDGWRKAWFYHYNYEKQFPYTPNIRGIRTDRWKYVRYPHGDGTADRHLAELYDLSSDPQELNNLVLDPTKKELIKQLSAELNQLMQQADIGQDRMPMDEGIKSGLPDKDIR